MDELKIVGRSISLGEKLHNNKSKIDHASIESAKRLIARKVNETTKSYINVKFIQIRPGEQYHSAFTKLEKRMLKQWAAENDLRLSIFNNGSRHMDIGVYYKKSGFLSRLFSRGDK